MTVYRLYPQYKLVTVQKCYYEQYRLYYLFQGTFTLPADQKKLLSLWVMIATAGSGGTTLTLWNITL